MANSDGGVCPRCFLKKYISQRLADQIAPAHNNHMSALYFYARTDKQFLNAMRGAGQETGFTKAHSAYVYRVKAVYIFIRVYGV